MWLVVERLKKRRVERHSDRKEDMASVPDALALPSIS